MSHASIPDSFRGFVGDPRNEMEVVYLFALAQGYLPFPFAATAVHQHFPDCEGIDPTNGKRVLIEFELKSRHFRAHGHKQNGCDHIVCWEDDWPDAPLAIRRKIVVLGDIYRAHPDLNRHYIHRPLASALRKQLEANRKLAPSSYRDVMALFDGLAELQGRYPLLVVDDTGTRQFSVRYGSGKNIVGIRPNGTVAVGSVLDMRSKYPGDLEAPVIELRRAAKTGLAEAGPAALLSALQKVLRVIAGEVHTA